MDNDDGLNNAGGNDYGNEDYDDGNLPNNNDGGNNNADGDVDQYFDDAGDIGYLPADHVTPISFLTVIASNAKTPKRFD